MMISVAQLISFTQIHAMTNLPLILDADEWSDKDLEDLHLAVASEGTPLLSDTGMRSAAQCFLSLTNLDINYCPNLQYPTNWLVEG